jgi:hypothetical protein
MKITLRQLRSLIREMAFDKLSKMTRTTDPHEDEEGEVDSYKSMAASYRGVEKYFKSTKSWVEKAKKTYKNIQSKIWIIPNFEYSDIRDNKILSFEEALPIIEMSDYAPEEVETHLDSGGTLWIVNAADLSKDFWPSPWLTIHAIFDSEILGGAYDDFLKSTVVPILEFLQEVKNEEREIGLPKTRSHLALFNHILVPHMAPDIGSARNGTLPVDSESDIASELAVSVIKRGGHLDIMPFNVEIANKEIKKLIVSENHEEYVLFFENKLNEFKDLVESLNIDQKFNAFISGKILSIDSSPA